MSYLDLIAGVIELAGKWITGDKNRWGHALNFLCCIIWIVYVFNSKSTYGLLLIVVPALFINIRNFVKWTKEDKDTDLKQAIHAVIQIKQWVDESDHRSFLSYNTSLHKRITRLEEVSDEM